MERARVQEELDIEEAVRWSVREQARMRTRLARSLETLERRLAARKLRRVPTAGTGACLFHAVIESGSVLVAPARLRAEAVGYMKRLPEWFAGSVSGPFAGFAEYLEYMEKPSSWRDHLVVVAISHLLMRPVRIVTDSTLESTAVTVVEPPSVVAETSWGPPILIAYCTDFNYETTVPVDLVEPLQGSGVLRSDDIEAGGTTREVGGVELPATPDDKPTSAVVTPH